MPLLPSWNGPVLCFAPEAVSRLAGAPARASARHQRLPARRAGTSLNSTSTSRRPDAWTLQTLAPLRGKSSTSDSIFYYLESEASEVSGGFAGKERRYSPATCKGMETIVVQGAPDLNKANTSYVERHNLTMRMSMRRFTRLTNGFSKKIAQHAAMLSIYFYWYNWCRPNKAVRCPTCSLRRNAE